MKKDKKSKEFETICSICGFPITKMQVVAFMDRVFVTDYVAHQEVCVSMTFCSECWAKLKENNTQGLKKAIKRYKKLQELK